MKKIKELKEKILNELEGGFIVNKIAKEYNGNDLDIRINFSYNGRNGICSYTLLGGEAGISNCNFKEKEDEDIGAEIHKWVREHIEFRTIVKCDGKEIK
jgi:hypothetical protein